MVSVHQEIVDKAYNAHADAFRARGFASFLLALDVRERDAVVMGKLNQQVCNGGFDQWIYNGYNAEPQFLVSALEKVGTSASRRVLELCEQVLRQRGEAANDELEDLCFDDEDTEFFKLADEFEADCEAYFARATT